MAGTSLITCASLAPLLCTSPEQNVGIHHRAVVRYEGVSNVCNLMKICTPVAKRNGVCFRLGVFRVRVACMCRHCEKQQKTGNECCFPHRDYKHLLCATNFVKRSMAVYLS